MVGEGDFWKGRRVLVTGGAGFVGYSLASKLVLKGARVYVLDIKPTLPAFDVVTGAREKILYVRGSVASKKTMKDVIRKGKIQTVFHLAAEAIVARAYADAESMFVSNVQGTWTVIEAARTAKSVKEVVVASSDKAYGAQARLPYREDAPLQGLNPYDNSKSCTDLIAQMYGKSYQLPIAVVRCGNIYGPGDTNWSRLIPDAMRHGFAGSSLSIRSDGTFRRDYIYVDDAVSAYMCLAERVARDRLFGEAFNFGNNDPRRVVETLKDLSRVMPNLQFKILGTAKNEIKDQYLDSTKAGRVLGWQPLVGMRDGLERAQEWYSKYFSTPAGRKAIAALK